MDQQVERFSRESLAIIVVMIAVLLMEEILLSSYSNLWRSFSPPTSFRLYEGKTGTIVVAISACAAIAGSLLNRRRNARVFANIALLLFIIRAAIWFEAVPQWTGECSECQMPDRYRNSPNVIIKE